LAKLSQRAAALGLAGLTPQEQVALIAFSSHQVIGQGGFRRFYEGTIPLTDLVGALRALKLNAVANAALATRELLPDPALADDPEARKSELAALDTQRQDYVFFRLSSDELLTAIASYWKRVGQPTSV
jgi:hypothetical protein